MVLLLTNWPKWGLICYRSMVTEISVVFLPKYVPLIKYEVISMKSYQYILEKNTTPVWINLIALQHWFFIRIFFAWTMKLNSTGLRFNLFCHFKKKFIIINYRFFYFQVSVYQRLRIDILILAGSIDKTRKQLEICLFSHKYPDHISISQSTVRKIQRKLWDLSESRHPNVNEDNK